MTPVTQYCGKSGRLEFNPINYMLPSLTIPTYTSTLDASTASPELIEFCREYGILHYKLQAFFTNANIVRSLCHIDVHNITQQSQPRINWVLTAPSSYMQWFDTSSALPVPKPRDSLDYTAYDCRPLAPLHTEYMRGGYVVETAIAHVVQNPTSEARWCVSITPQFASGHVSLGELLARLNG
jgi:hypothetical protein